jgi:hypothetical protein
MKRRDFIKGAVAGGGLLSAGMVSGIGDALAASGSEAEKTGESKKSLVFYASRSGNTAKVARRFKATLEKNGWQCDIAGIEEGADPMAFPYNLRDYDLLCAGSGVRFHQPYEELINVIQAPVYGFDPRMMKRGMDFSELTEEDKKKMQAAMGDRKGTTHAKVVLGPDHKHALSFLTYGGHDFGPEEAQPALDLINLELMHLHLEAVGKFCCPGKFENESIPYSYYPDLPTRPNDRDLLAAELFMEKMLEKIAVRPPNPRYSKQG